MNEDKKDKNLRSFSSYAQYRQKRQHGTPEFPVAYFHLPMMQPADVISLHWHPECELIHVLEGTMDIYVDGTLYQVPAGSYFLIYGEYFHSADISHCVQETIVFSSDRLLTGWPLCRKEREQLDSHTLFIDPMLSGSPALHRICEEIFRLLSAADAMPYFMVSPEGFDVAALSEEGLPSSARLQIIGLLYQLFGAIFAEEHYMDMPESQLSLKSMEKLKSALSYVEEHYRDQITLDQLARAAGLNAKYLCRLFRSATLSTPMEYLNRYRIDQASRRLLTTEATITQVALECGFNDVSYFTRLFKRYKNQTPSAYARQKV